MRSVKEFFLGKDMPETDEEKKKALAANPANLTAQVTQIKDVAARKRKMLEELDK